LGVPGGISEVALCFWGEDCRYETAEQLAAPLLAIYWSLWECGSGVVADGRLLDTLRRIYAFGMCLMKLDIRQEAPRHEEAINTITEFLGMGSYKEWDEDKKVEWLLMELQGCRPLISPVMEMSPEVKEILDTFGAVAQLGRGSLGAYVISMASSASDILAVELLQREARMQMDMQVPLSRDLRVHAPLVSSFLLRFRDLLD